MNKGRDNLKAQEELEKILIYETLIESKSEELIRLDSLIKKMTAAMEGEAVSRSRNLDPLGTAIAKKEKLFNEIAQIQNDYERQKEFLSGIIDGLRKPVFIKILYGKYFFGKSLKKISNETIYSYRHIQNLHDDALEAVQKILIQKKVSV